MKTWNPGDRIAATDINGNFAAAALRLDAGSGLPQARVINDRWADTANLFDFVPAGTVDPTGQVECGGAFKVAHDLAVAAGYRYLFIPRGTYLTATLTQCGNLIFVGPGVLLGAYRKSVFPQHLSGKMLVRGECVPKTQLVQLQAAMAAATTMAPAVIALVGDSWMVRAANQFSKSESFQELVTERLAREFPGRPFVVQNFGIGSQTWTNVNSFPSAGNFPSWYTDHSKPWLYYVQQAAPDLVILMAGGNDGPNLDPAQFRGALSTIAGWVKPPSVMLCTTAQRSLMTGAGAVVAQEGLAYAYGCIRTYAAFAGIALLDFGRQMDLVRDGIDILQQPLLALNDGVTTTLPFVFPQACTDFAATVTVPGATGSIWSNGSLTVQIGNDAANTLAIDKDGGTGNLAVKVNTTAAIASWPRTVGSFAPGSSTADFVLEVSVKGARLLAILNGTQLFDADVERFGGLFAPRIAFSGGGSISATVQPLVGVPALSMPQCIDSEVWGAAVIPSQWAPDGGPYAGNAVAGHMSSIGIQRVMQPVLDVTRFAA